MRGKTLPFAVLIFLLSIEGSSGAQETNPATISVSVNLVKVPISVFDSQGNLVGELKRDNFRIWEDQAVQEIRSFGLDRNPVSVVLLVDTSMSGKTELKNIKEAAEDFADALSKGDRISLITFDDEVYLTMDWTDDVKKVRKALGKLRPGLRTALYDAMFVAANEQLKEVEGRKAVILLTDCLDNQSRVNFRGAALAMVQSQASLYVVSKTAIVREQAKQERRVRILDDIYKRLFGRNSDYIDEFFEKREAEMTSLAEQTGGRCFFPNDYDEIKGVYAEVARELKSKYYLTYVSNQEMLPDSYHRIAIEYLGSASKLIYRKGYYYEPRVIDKTY
jgi:Ca-activated chloride channel family protein